MDTVSVPTPKAISVEFFSRRGNKDERLINSDGSAPFDARARWFNYAFSQPVYLTEISITVDGYGAGDKFDLEVEHVDGTLHEERVPVNSATVTLRLGKLCRGFSRLLKKSAARNFFLSAQPSAFGFKFFGVDGMRA